jgi:hypothetical protein
MAVYQGFWKISRVGWKKFPLLTAEIAGQIFTMNLSARLSC